jgi:hypothetical protein
LKYRSTIKNEQKEIHTTHQIEPCAKRRKQLIHFESRFYSPTRNFVNEKKNEEKKETNKTKGNESGLRALDFFCTNPWGGGDLQSKDSTI